MLEQLKEQHELKDCTFKPEINKERQISPQAEKEGYNIHERLYKETKNYNSIEKMKQQRELVGCTFKPVLKSLKDREKQLSRVPNHEVEEKKEEICERLYHQYKLKQDQFRTMSEKKPSLQIDNDLSIDHLVAISSKQDSPESKGSMIESKSIKQDTSQFEVWGRSHKNVGSFFEEEDTPEPEVFEHKYYCTDERTDESMTNNHLMTRVLSDSNIQAHAPVTLHSSKYKVAKDVLKSGKEFVKRKREKLTKKK